jgi:hypothetical protein
MVTMRIAYRYLPRQQEVDSHEPTLPLSANDAVERAKDHLAEYLKEDVQRFEQWHGITPTDR